METKENPNAKYDALADKSGMTNYLTIYETTMKRLANNIQIPVPLQKALEEKREFGIKKYGDRSFQASFEASMSSPVLVHLGDEIIDAYNYSLHALMVANIRADYNDIKKIEDIMAMLDRVRFTLNELSKEKPQEIQDALKWTASE